MEEENRSPRKTWDLMIGFALVFLGSFRLYNRLQEESEWDYKVILTVLFIGYGSFLIFRHFQNSKRN